MRMVIQFLAPCMKDLDDAGRCAEILFISSKLKKRLGTASVQGRVQELLVGREDGIQFSRNGKNDMKVRGIYHLGSAAVDPNLFEDCLTVRTVAVSAGVCVHVGKAAFVTGLDVISKPARLAVHDAKGSLFLDSIRPERPAEILPAVVKYTRDPGISHSYHPRLNQKD